MSRDSLEMYQRTLGNEHPLVAQAMNNLAIWVFEAGDLASAEPLVRGALDMRLKLLGPDHADTANSMTLLAGLLVETGRYDEALALATKAQAILLKALGPGHWRTASAEAAEGAALAGLKQYPKAEQLSWRAMRCWRRTRRRGTSIRSTRAVGSPSSTRRRVSHKRRPSTGSRNTRNTTDATGACTVFGAVRAEVNLCDIIPGCASQFVLPRQQ